jgi:hypothetical protein
MRIRALGTVAIDDDAADRAVGRGQARELLALLLAHPGQRLDTGAVIDALWGGSPPPTAATIVHGAVSRLRKALGGGAVSRTEAGYMLEQANVSVDLWDLNGLIDAGRLAEARAMVVEPVLGPYATRPWALAVGAGLAERLRPTVAPRPPGGGAAGVPISRLVGRRRELAALRDAHRRSRLVTVVGLGGVGKSRLVAELVTEIDGPVARVDLALASGSFASRVAAEMGAVAGEGDTALVATAALLGDTTSVLVLDGCEHDLDDVVDTIPSLLQRCPRLSVVATSRVALGLPGEQVVPLLPFADPADPLGDGVELVLDRLRAIGLPFDPDDRQRAAAICLHCAGVPLAIELAAAEVLGGELPATGGDGPGAVVVAVVEQAVAALSPTTAMAARRAAWLPAGATSGLLARLHRGGGAVAARELLTAGLVGVDGSGARRRLRFPDTVRASLLEHSEEADLVATARVLGALAGAARPEVDQAPALGPLAEAIAEITNAHGLLTSLAEAGRHDERLALALGFATAWREDGHWVIGSGELERALAACDEAGLVDEALRPRAVYEIVNVAGTYEVASRWADRVGVMASEALANGQPELATAMRALEANGLGYAGRVAEAWAAVEQAKVAAAASTSPTVHLFVDTLRASSHLLGGDPYRARTELSEVALHATELGAYSDAARLRRLASIAARTAGDLHLALTEAEIGEEQAQTSLARGTLAIIRGEIADLRFVLDPPSALPALRTALATASVAGQLRMSGVCRLRLGLLEDDREAVAAAAADLLAVDARWAALALSHVLDTLPARHPLARLIPQGIGSLTWGTPLSAGDQARVDAIGAPSGPAPDGWQDAVVAELLAVRS